MTISSEANRSGPYNGNGVTTIFDYDFKIYDEAHLRVIKDVSGVETVLTLNSDYIVSGVGSAAGGQIATTVAPAAGETITIIPSVPFTQEVDLENQGAYYAETVERAFDLAAMRDQQLQEQLDRAIKLPASDTSGLAESPDSIGILIRNADSIVTVAASIQDVETVSSDMTSVNSAAANISAIIAAPAAAADAAASAAETEVLRDETEAAANRALNATAYGYNGGRFLLGFENGVGFNLAQNDVAIIGGPSPVSSAAPASVLSLTRASAADVIDGNGYISTVASGALALTRNPLTGRSSGLFVGAAADNLAVSPDDLTVAGWVKTNLTVTAAAGTSPDGTLNAFRLADTSNTTYGEIAALIPSVPGLTTDGYAVISYFLKSIDAVRVQLRPSFYNGGAALNMVATVNLQTGVVEAVANCTATVTNYGDGWMRVDVFGQNNSTGNTGIAQRVRVEPLDLPTMLSLLMWKPTVYLGQRYLGTVDGRENDLVSMPLSAIDWNAVEGTLCCDVEEIPVSGQVVNLLQVDDGTQANRITLRLNANGFLFGDFVRDSIVTGITGGTAAYAGGRFAITWDSQEFAVYLNGDIVATSPIPDGLPIGLTTLRIGGNSAGGAQPQTTFSKVFYKAREMTAAEIAAAGVVSASSSGGGGGAGEFSAAEISAIDAAALAQSAAVRSSGNPYVTRFKEGFNWVAQYGQSLSVGALGHPPRSWSQQYDAVMIGGSVRGSSSGGTFVPYGSSALSPIAPTVEGGGAVLNSAQIEALAWTDTNSGETSAVGFTEMAKFLWNQHVAADNDASRKFVVTSTGAGGLPIASLEKGTDPYSRTVSAADLVKTLAGATASQLHMILYEQGESDADDGSTYKADLLQLKADLEADIATAVFGQARMPAFFLYQVSGRWLNDAAEPTTVPAAQLEAALENDDIFLYAPSYRATEKPDGHLDANGYRWLGMMLAKCWYRVIVKGEGWKPLHITDAYVRGAEVLLAYHVPVPPVKFGVFYDQFTAMDYASKGFRVLDDSGSVPITSVEVVGGATIKLTLSRDTVGEVTVKYATKTTFNGGGNVMDSDSLQSFFDYEYLPAAGDDATANVAALVGNPYPLENPACVQNIVAVAA